MSSLNELRDVRAVCGRLGWVVNFLCAEMMCVRWSLRSCFFSSLGCFFKLNWEIDRWPFFSNFIFLESLANWPRRDISLTRSNYAEYGNQFDDREETKFYDSRIESNMKSRMAEAWLWAFYDTPKKIVRNASLAQWQQMSGFIKTKINKTEIFTSFLCWNKMWWKKVVWKFLGLNLTHSQACTLRIVPYLIKFEKFPIHPKKYYVVRSIIFMLKDEPSLSRRLRALIEHRTCG